MNIAIPVSMGLRKLGFSSKTDRLIIDTKVFTRPYFGLLNDACKPLGLLDAFALDEMFSKKGHYVYKSSGFWGIHTPSSKDVVASITVEPERYRTDIMSTSFLQAYPLVTGTMRVEVSQQRHEDIVKSLTENLSTILDVAVDLVYYNGDEITIRTFR